MTKQSNNIPQNSENQGTPVPFFAGYPQAYSDDEISLIDLAKILIRNWWVVVAGVFVCLALAWFAAPKTPSYEYITLIESGVNENNEPIESNAAVEAQLTSVFLPRVIRGFLADKPERDELQFRVSVDSLRGTAIVRLTSTAVFKTSEEVETIHEALVQEVLTRQTQRLETARDRIQTKIEQLNATINGSENEEARSAARLELAALEVSLRNLEEPNLLALAEQSLQPVGRGLVIYLVLGLIVGVMGGVVGAFFWEFVIKVRESMKEDAAQRQPE
ncbi:MAG: hypothetical protein JXQ97_01385 [Natronospirillum sp.]